MKKKTKKQTLPIQSKNRKEKSKWTKKKIIAASVIGAAALAFAVFMIVVLVLGLGSVRPIKSTEEEAKVVGNCGGYEIKYEELRYLTLLHRNSLDKELGKYDQLSGEQKKAYETALEERVAKDIKKNYVILSLCEQYGIDADSKEVKDHVQDQIELLVSESFEGSMKSYKAWLSENNLTDGFLRLLYKVDRLESLLLSHIVDNKLGIEYDNDNKLEFVDYIMEGKDWVRTIHAFYPKESEYVDVSGYAEKAKQTAEKLQAISDDAERENAMRTEIGAAPFVSEFSITGNGIYFTYGAMIEAYEKASFDLELYGVSDVVETEDGYYVIMRMPLEREHLNLNTVPDLLTQYQYAVLKGYEEKAEESLSFEGNAYFEALVLTEIG